MSDVMYGYIHRCRSDFRCTESCYMSKIHKFVDVWCEHVTADMPFPACGASNGDLYLSGYADVHTLDLPHGALQSLENLVKYDLCKRCFKGDLPVLDRLAGI